MSAIATRMANVKARLELMEHLARDLEFVKSLPKYQCAVFAPVFKMLDLPEGSDDWPAAWKIEMWDCMWAMYVGNATSTDNNIKEAVHNFIFEQQYIERWNELSEVFGLLRIVEDFRHKQFLEEWKSKQRVRDKQFVNRSPVPLI